MSDFIKITQHPDRPDPRTTEFAKDFKRNSLDIALDGLAVQTLMIAAIKKFSIYQSGPLTIAFLDRPFPGEPVAFLRLNCDVAEGSNPVPTTSDYSTLADALAEVLALGTNYSGRIVVTLRGAPEQPSQIFHRGPVSIAIEFGSSVYDGARSGPQGEAKNGNAKDRKAWDDFTRGRLIDPVLDGEEISGVLAEALITQTNYRGRLIWTLNRSVSGQHGDTLVANVVLEDHPVYRDRNPARRASAIATSLASFMHTNVSYSGGITILLPDHAKEEPQVFRHDNLTVGFRFGQFEGIEPLLDSYAVIKSEYIVEE